MPLTTCAWNDMHDSDNVDMPNDVDDSNGRLNIVKVLVLRLCSQSKCDSFLEITRSQVGRQQHLVQRC